MYLIPNFVLIVCVNVCVLLSIIGVAQSEIIEKNILKAVVSESKNCNAEPIPTRHILDNFTQPFTFDFKFRTPIVPNRPWDLLRIVDDKQQMQLRITIDPIRDMIYCYIPHFDSFVEITNIEVNNTDWHTMIFMFAKFWYIEKGSAISFYFDHEVAKREIETERLKFATSGMLSFAQYEDSSEFVESIEINKMEFDNSLYSSLWTSSESSDDDMTIQLNADPNAPTKSRITVLTTADDLYACRIQPTHIQGVTGAPGLQESSSPPDFTGSTGSSGEEDAQETTGATSLQGSSSQLEPSGDTGAQGVTDTPDLQGFSGPPDSAGSTGPSSGEKRTEEETEAPGLQGLSGLPDPTGSSGPSEEEGAQRETVAPGLQGLSGPPDLTESSGPSEKQDTQGETGAPGVQGLIGPPGRIGPTGPSEEKGAQGAPGARGLQGPVGPPGASEYATVLASKMRGISIGVLRELLKIRWQENREVDRAHDPFQSTLEKFLQQNTLTKE